MYPAAGRGRETAPPRSSENRTSVPSSSPRHGLCPGTRCVVLGISAGSVTKLVWVRDDAGTLAVSTAMMASAPATQARCRQGGERAPSRAALTSSALHGAPPRPMACLTEPSARMLRPVASESGLRLARSDAKPRHSEQRLRQTPTRPPHAPTRPRQRCVPIGSRRFWHARRTEAAAAPRLPAHGLSIPPGRARSRSTGSTVESLRRAQVGEHPRNEPGEHALRRVESLGELASRSDPKLAVGA